MESLYNLASTPIGLIASVITAVFGSQVLAGLVTSWFGRKKVDSEALKDKADADATTTRVTLELVAVLNTRISKLETDLDNLRKENIELRLENVELREQIATLTKKVEN